MPSTRPRSSASFFNWPPSFMTPVHDFYINFYFVYFKLQIVRVNLLLAMKIICSTIISRMMEATRTNTKIPGIKLDVNWRKFYDFRTANIAVCYNNISESPDSNQDKLGQDKLELQLTTGIWTPPPHTPSIFSDGTRDLKITLVRVTTKHWADGACQPLLATLLGEKNSE